MGCGKVEDIYLQPEPDIVTMKVLIDNRIGYELIGYGMELYGLCPACRDKENHARIHEI
jgi:Fe2+ or Zn2+ uptake regulation protein